MSISKPPQDNLKRPVKQTATPRSLRQALLSLPHKRHLLASIALHLVFIFVLLFHWETTEPAKVLYIPSNIQAHVVSPDVLKQLQAKKEAEQKAIDELSAREKQILEEKRKALEAKKLAEKKAKEEAQKKAALEKQRAEQEKLKIKKQQEEREKLDKAKLEKIKQEKLAEEQKKREQEQKKRELDQKKAEQLALEKAQELKQKEQKLLDTLTRMEQQQALAQQAAAAEAELNRRQQEYLKYELTEVERFMALIKSRIENVWRIPPKSDGLAVSLRIRLLPTGEWQSVEVIKSSGNTAFDQSAVLAAKSVNRYPVPDDLRVFEQNFRQFAMAFRPVTDRN